jgi:hypothetical protein
MNRKTVAIIVGLLVIALAAMGIGYGLWYELLFIDGTVHTGNVDIYYTIYPPDVEENDHGKDVGECKAGYHYDSDASGDDEFGGELWFEILNGYPSYECWITFDVHSAGTIPVHVYRPEFTNLPPADELTVDLVECWADDMGAPMGDEYVQLHEDEVAFCTIYVHVEQGASELATYDFSGTIEGRQFNIERCNENGLPEGCENATYP